jgi:Uma2 family endonuclease
MTATALPLLFKLPTSFEERLALGDEIRIPATLEEYLEFAEQAEYKVEYSNGKIVSMGQATDAHEQIIINAGWAFSNLFTDEDSYRMYGSNLGVYIPETNAHYKPDATILNALPEFILHKVRKRTLKSVLNPLAVIEVFSDSTIDYDMTEKLPNYKQSSSLRYVVFIHQHKPYVSLHVRSNQASSWFTVDCMGIDASFQFEGKTVLLKDLYRKVIFMGADLSGKRKKKP